ncbi:MAG TPA: alpha/beta hydrolase [Burkholderiaceae bacterium]|nr:alpha/beta hydrolase [Burkholderiaceae bacterium]
MKRLAVACALLLAAAAACAQPEDHEPAWTRGTLPGVGMADLPVLHRAERTPPLRYRVVVLPGSGCAGLAPIAQRYFAGLLHAEVLVLHKPGTDLDAGPAPAQCTSEFVAGDDLARWHEHARHALRMAALDTAARVPTVLVGISEGGELLPALAPELPGLAGLVLLSSPGLDPREAGELQARRGGVLADWQALGKIQASALPDTALVQGRSLGYWRSFWRWPLAQPLIDAPWPLLQVWGEADALVPAEAYQRFAMRAQGRAAPFCTRSFAGADHGLQGVAPGIGRINGVQRVWAWLEQWARAPQDGWCAMLPP